MKTKDIFGNPIIVKGSKLEEAKRKKMMVGDVTQLSMEPRGMGRNAAIGITIDLQESIREGLLPKNYEKDLLKLAEKFDKEFTKLIGQWS